jgi:nitroreductase
MEGDKAVVKGPWSLGCGHCAAACPTAAIAVGFVDSDALNLRTVEVGDAYLQPGEFDTASLVRLMQSRRSCRNYTDSPVPRDMLDDLVRVGTMAPTGTNSQLWSFTVLTDRQVVMELGLAVKEFFVKLNRRAKNPVLRALSRLFFKDVLGIYYRDHHETVQEGIRQWEEEQRDRLFHGAPAAILIGSRPGGSTPREDALLASQNMLLAAHAMGLGTCLVGFVVEALRHKPGILSALGIPPDEKVHSVIAVGYPDEEYQHPAGRRSVRPRYIQLPGD